MITRIANATLVLAVLLAAGSPVSAQYVWTGGAGNGNWVDPLNWDTNPVIPVSSDSTSITLDRTVQTVTNQNIASSFILNQLILGGGASDGFTINGGELVFDGSAAFINTQAASVSGSNAVLRVNSATTFNLDTAINLDVNNNTGQELILAGPVRAAAGTVLTVSGGNGTGWTISSSNAATFHGTIAFGSGASTIVSLGANNAVSRTTVLNLTGASNVGGVRTGTTTGSGPGFADAAFNQQIGGLIGTGGGTSNGGLQIGTSANASILLAGFDDASTTYNGAIATPLAGAHFGKVGTGTLTLGGASTSYAGSFSVRDGAVSIGGTTTATLGAGTGTPPVLPITVYAGGELRTVTGTSTNGRIANTATVTLTGGLFRMNATGLGSSTSGYSDVVSTLTAAAGQSTIQVEITNNRVARWSFSSLASPGVGATLFFQANNLGVNALGSGINGGNVNFGTAPTSQLVGTTTTYGGSSLDLAILPYGFASSTSSGGPTTFVTYDGVTSSIRGLADTNYDAALGTATNNVSLSAGATLSSNTTSNALRTTGASALIIDLNGHDLTITSGALLDTNTASTTISGSGNLFFGPSGTSTAYITNNDIAILSLHLNTAATAAHFSKNGPSTVHIGNTFTLGNSSTVAINDGTVALESGGSFTNGNGVVTYQISKPGTLNTIGVGGLTLGTGKTLRGNGSVTGSVTLVSGGVIEPNALPGPGLLSAQDMIWQGGSTYRWTVSSVLTDSNFDSLYTAGKIQSTGTLDLAGASSGNPIEIELVSLSLSGAAGPVYDLSPSETYTWRIAEFASISGFSADKFTLDTSNFSGGGTFSISADSTSLYVTYGTPIPEPTTLLGLSALGLFAARAIRRRRAASME